MGRTAEGAVGWGSGVKPLGYATGVIGESVSGAVCAEKTDPGMSSVVVYPERAMGTSTLG